MAHRVANDSRLARDNHRQTEVDDLFAEWDSDPLELLSLPRPRAVVRRVLCRNTNCHTPRRRDPHARRLLLILVLTLPRCAGSTRRLSFTRTFYGLRYQSTDCGTLGIVSAPHGVFGVVGQPMSTAKSRRQAVGVGELALERWVKKSYNGTCRRTQPAAQTQLGAAR